MKEIGKEGLIIAKELKRLSSHPLSLDRFIRSHVSRLLKSDLVAVLAEFQRHNQVFLCMKKTRRNFAWRPNSKQFWCSNQTRDPVIHFTSFSPSIQCYVAFYFVRFLNNGNYFCCKMEFLILTFDCVPLTCCW